MIRKTSSIIAALCLSALTLGLGACSSAPDAKDDRARKKTSIATPYQVKKLSAEELANTPCGNPDWAQLPEGAEIKSAEPDKESPTTPAAEEPAPQTSNSMAPDAQSASVFAQAAPCT
ncbi:hypothetical protein [Bradymonas sediminis]|uniref:Uncharacterized protein n=1 Tax=Bradymonas sediminis TaxID=1548548 RepID=A0A2Z4FGY6_9DELT|nr:hypothetical protein [Bradymonas sediminis]AWV88237.1 hypothetical protein DN745_02330 [Bradymonas sediminis]TDP77359.1 hypothetical protein DFR33_101259 [Bradymonas sediminis]